MQYYSLLVITQIVTESLPISSSGHVHLLKRFLNHCINNNKISVYLDSYEILMQCAHVPIVCIIILFFLKRWFFLLRHALRLQRIIVKIIIQTSIACIITAIWYLIVHMLSVHSSLLMGFIITACVLYITRYIRNAESCKVVWWYTVILGLVQACALMPGISRFASVYTVARMLGLAHRQAFEMTFVIVLPLFSAASIYATYQIYHHNEVINVIFVHWWLFTIASVAAWFLFCFVERVARQGYLWLFGVYMVIPIMLLLLV